MALNCVTEPEKPPSSKMECPEKTSSLMSRLTFSWVLSLVLKGFRKPLKQEDLWLLDEENTVKSVYGKFNEQCQDRQTEREAEESPLRGNISNSECPKRLLQTLIKVFFPTFVTAAFLRLFVEVLVFLQPYAMLEVYKFTESGTDQMWHGFLNVGLLLVIYLLKNIVQQQQEYKIKLVDLRIRSALFSAIYRKVLKVSNSYCSTNLSGDVTNLITNDVEQLTNLLFYFNDVWVAPIQIVVLSIILWCQLGEAMIAGIGVMVLGTLLSLITSWGIRFLQTRRSTMKDKRYQLIHEVLRGIKVIKLNAWEEGFEQKFKRIRSKETSLLKKFNFLQSFSDFIWNASSVGVQFVSYYIFLGDKNKELNSYVALGAYLYFRKLKVPFSLLPYAFVAYSQSLSSLKRIHDFLNGGELSINQVKHDVSENNAVEIEGGSFAWGKTQGAVLHDLTVSVKRGSLVAVVGSVGSGKTSLLSALLGEMEKIGGSIKILRSVAFVPQQAWIRNDTVKHNILFGSRNNEAWYREVLRACALEQDLNMFPGGDQTIVGDQGMNLSGGQKHRVSLARAVYLFRDLYLLDDTLSAFDAVVGRQIFERVIGPRGLLKTKTRIFVTHSLAYLLEVDTVLFIEGGKIVETGTYDDLMSKKLAFYKFVENSKQQCLAVDELMAALKCQGEIPLEGLKPNTPIAERGENGSTCRDKCKAYRSIVETEERSKAVHVPNSVCLGYLKARWFLLLCCTFPLVLHHFSNLLEMWVLQCWGEGTNHVIDIDNGSCVREDWVKERCGMCVDDRWRYYNITYNTTINITDINVTYDGNSTDYEDEVNREKLETLMVFSSFGLISAGLALVVEVVVRHRLLTVGHEVHRRMLRAVLAAPLSFFDFTPFGRIITRFTHDVNVLDYSLPRQVYWFLLSITGILSTSIIMLIHVPVLSYFLLPVFIVYSILLRCYLKTNRELRGLQVVSLSPVNSLLGETYLGMTSIRAFKVQKKFQEEFDAKIDLLQQFNYHFTVVTLWLNVWLEFLGIAVLILTSLYEVFHVGMVLSAQAGQKRERFDSLVVLFASSMIFWFMQSVRSAAEIETNIVSLERTQEYQVLCPEEGNHKRSNEEWLKEGKLQIQNLFVKYRENQDYILKDINLSVEPGQKIGVVGRTGAGKSSMALVVFSVLKPAEGCGQILIDDSDVSNIAINDLRSQLSIIPQDPVLFTGTLRMNLDPLESKSDSELWEVLEKVPDLKKFILQLPEKLAFKVTCGGANLSVGQKQLICLVRALLRKSKLLIMDEATSSVDLHTDQMIHKTVREEFRDSTVIIIAHRLKTVMDTDKVMVLEDGKIIEFDSPDNLKSNTTSVFFRMALNAGLVNAEGN